MNLEGVWHELDTKFHYKPISSLEATSCDLKFLENSSLQVWYENAVSTPGWPSGNYMALIANRIPATGM
jgi:hypothetical protein